MRELYDTIVDWYIAHFRVISISLTLLISIATIVIKAYKKGWEWKNVIDLGAVLPLVFTCYSAPTAILLLICCFDVSKLEGIAGIGIYIIASSIALFHTFCSAIKRYGD